MIAHGRKKPGDYQGEIFIGSDVDEIPQLVNTASTNGRRQGEHAIRPDESDPWLAVDRPTSSVDPNRAPVRIGQIDIDSAVVAANPDVYLMFTTVEPNFYLGCTKGLFH